MIPLDSCADVSQVADTTHNDIKHQGRSAIQRLFWGTSLWSCTWPGVCAVAALEPLLQEPHARRFAAILYRLKANVLVQPLGGMIISAHLQGQLAAPEGSPFCCHPL